MSQEEMKNTGNGRSCWVKCSQSCGCSWILKLFILCTL